MNNIKKNAKPKYYRPGVRLPTLRQRQALNNTDTEDLYVELSQ